MSIGWLDFDTPAFQVLADWYRGIGSGIKSLGGKEWSYEELIDTERRLGGEEYEHVFQIK